MEDRHAVASSVFFTGVSLVIDKDRLRQHFETVGHVVNFTVYGPATGKDFRYGIAGYMDPQTAEEAIRRLNGTTFGERAMRVTPARATSLHGPLRAGPGGEGSGPADHTPFRKRPREPFGSAPPSSRPPFAPGMGRGRGAGGGGFRGPPGRAPYPPFAAQAAAGAPPQEPPPPTDKDGRETMVFPRFYLDPVLGREGSLVLEVLRGMATEEAYAAMEQLRVLALERPSEARRLLHHNPALKSAVVMTLQHAGRIPFGSLPREAYLSRRGMEAEAEAVAAQAAPQPRPAEEPDTTQPSTPLPAAPAEKPVDTAAAEAPAAAVGTAAGTAGMAAAPVSAPAPALAPTPAPAPKPIKKDAKPARKRETATAGGGGAASPPPSSSSAPMTDAERDEVLQLIQNMSEEDVERVLTMSPGDLAQVPDAVQRRQLEVLQRRLLEMSKDL